MITSVSLGASEKILDSVGFACPENITSRERSSGMLWRRERKTREEGEWRGYVQACCRCAYRLNLSTPRGARGLLFLALLAEYIPCSMCANLNVPLDKHDHRTSFPNNIACCIQPMPMQPFCVSNVDFSLLYNPGIENHYIHTNKDTRVVISCYLTYTSASEFQPSSVCSLPYSSMRNGRYHSVYHLVLPSFPHRYLPAQKPK